MADHLAVGDRPRPAVRQLSPGYLLIPMHTMFGIGRVAPVTVAGTSRMEHMNNKQWLCALSISALSMMGEAQAAESGFYATAYMLACKT